MDFALALVTLLAGPDAVALRRFVLAREAPLRGTFGRLRLPQESVTALFTSSGRAPGRDKVVLRGAPEKPSGSALFPLRFR